MIEIIPAIDIIEGKCVRLSQGDYGTKKVYNENPIEVAKEFEYNGIKRLHLVDLEGAKAKHIVNWKVLEKISSQTELKIDFGGGVKSDKDVEIAFNSGASMITGGSIAVKEPEVFLQWLFRYGAEKIILGADVRENYIAVEGWKEKSKMELLPFVENYIKKGVGKIISTNVSNDGMLQGPDFSLYEMLKENFPSLYVIASGGVGSIKDIEKLNENGIDGVILGKSLYEGKIKVEELRPFLE
ncbi:MAG TPA: 1-(5-phosphoribosyl)-5-[(5-phosphoribosylamino)methylideneamino]imidazole-4-carboxamide isomerase [Porphyromonadaceae bacterium]|nr:1-(5-phosphoribosyl)-5-[(5-phosphoribosylamino)methylideneamino]imidazole-4-carboxamide isomerase [Porphyromonadaceae bacterium]